MNGLSILSRGILLSIIWWLLTGGDAASWWIGVPAVTLALITSIALLPSSNLVWHEFLIFVPFFLLRSLLGGADVARRAIDPRMPIAPTLFEYPLRLPAGLPQIFMANTISLLPGTLSAELSANCLTVHVLDCRGGFLAELEAVEQRVARLFDTSLKTANGDE